MVTLEQVREIALGLPEAEEAPHHDMPSFRVRGGIFATVPHPARLNVMLANDEVPLAVAMSTRAISELWWGKRLSGVTVNLTLASQTVVSELLGASQLPCEGTRLPPLPPVEVFAARRRARRC